MLVFRCWEDIGDIALATSDYLPSYSRPFLTMWPSPGVTVSPLPFSQLQQQRSESPLSAAAVAPELRLSGSVPRFLRGALRFSLERSTLSAAVYRVPTGSHGAYSSFRPRDGAAGISSTTLRRRRQLHERKGPSFEPSTFRLLVRHLILVELLFTCLRISNDTPVP